MTNKEQREVWRKVFEENRKKIVKKECPSCSDLYHGWLAACEYMHENMSQSRYNFWKLTRIQKKKIDFLVDALDTLLSQNNKRRCEEGEFLCAGHNSRFYNGYWISKDKADKALQKIKELDESEGR